MRIFKNKAFVRFAKKSAISDAMLGQAIRDAERGLIALTSEVESSSSASPVLARGNRVGFER